MNKYDVEYNRLMRKMERGGSLREYTFRIDTPTGNPSKLSYIQQILVRTTKFKEWFGDWERSARLFIDNGFENETSKVLYDFIKKKIDDNPKMENLYHLDFFLFHESAYRDVSKAIDIDTLEPRILYHGTNADEFFEFKTEVTGTSRPYAYFAFNREYSENFATSDNLIYEVFVRVMRPFPMSLFSRSTDLIRKDIKDMLSEAFLSATGNELDFERNAKVKRFFDYYDAKFKNVSEMRFWMIMASDIEGVFKDLLEFLNFDSVYYAEEISLIPDLDSTEKKNFTKAYTIFKPNQVKLGDGRNTDFFIESTDIRYAQGGEVENKLYDLVSHYTDLSGKPYFYKDGVLVRIKDHLANWSNFERINMDDGNDDTNYFLSIVIAKDPNNSLLRESDRRVEEFIERNEDDFDNLIAKEFIYDPSVPMEEIINDINYYISKMSQGKSNFANGGALQSREIMLPDTTAKYAHLRNVLKRQGFNIYPMIENNGIETFEVGGTIKHVKGSTTDGKKGGYFEGRSHADGGIKAFNVSTQTPIEVEGGEVIITKKAVDDDDLKEFEGEMLTNREILSRINQSGGGVAFEEGGEIHSCGCNGRKFAYGGETIEDYEIIRRLQSSYDNKENMKTRKTNYGHNLMRKMKEGGFI
jgi:hypothetical protein